METNADSIVSSICSIAMEATKIPLAVFTDLFHHRFKKKLYLDSTLELLQQFYIQLVNHSNYFCIFVGDCHKYCLHCARCHCAITRPDYNCVVLTCQWLRCWIDRLDLCNIEQGGLTRSDDFASCWFRIWDTQA
jgi:hypothetical protein